MDTIERFLWKRWKEEYPKGCENPVKKIERERAFKRIENLWFVRSERVQDVNYVNKFYNIPIVFIDVGYKTS